MRNEDIWNVYDEDGTLQYTIPKYDKDGCHTRRMAVAVTEQDGRFLLIRPISYEKQHRWSIPTLTLRYTIGQTDKLTNAEDELRKVLGLYDADLSLRSRSVDTATMNELYAAVVPGLAQLICDRCREKNLEYTYVTVRQWCELCQQGLFVNQDFPYSNHQAYCLGKAIRDTDIYDLPSL